MHHMVFCLGVLFFISACVSKKNKEAQVLLEPGKSFLISSENTSLSSVPKGKKLSKQLNALKTELASNKNNISVLNRIVDTLFFQKKYKEAISYAKQILIKESSNTKIRLKIAHAAIRMRKYSFAEFILSQLPCTKGSDCLNLKGVIAYNHGKIKEALDYYKRALTLSTKNISASLNLALLYMEFYKFDEALAEVKKILKIAPRDKHAKLLASRT
ncbi:MAG: tetratricopeptide repeat protein [Oligoflexales bacterium]